MTPVREADAHGAGADRARAHGARVGEAAATAGPDARFSPELRLLLARNRLARAEAQGIIDNHVIAGGAVSALPLPGLDLAALIDVQVNLIGRLADHYGVIHNPLGRNLVIGLLSGALPLLAAGLTLSLFKLVPGLGAAAGGVTLSAYGAATTYAVGHLFLGHFEAGGQLHDLDLATMRRRLRELVRDALHRGAPTSGDP